MLRTAICWFLIFFTNQKMELNRQQQRFLLKFSNRHEFLSQVRTPFTKRVINGAHGFIQLILAEKGNDARDFHRLKSCYAS